MKETEHYIVRFGFGKNVNVMMSEQRQRIDRRYNVSRFEGNFKNQQKTKDMMHPKSKYVAKIRRILGRV